MSRSPLDKKAEFAVIVNGAVDEAFERWTAGETFEDMVRTEPLRGIMELVLTESFQDPEFFEDIPPELRESVRAANELWFKQYSLMTVEERLATAASQLCTLVTDRADDGEGYNHTPSE